MTQVDVIDFKEMDIGTLRQYAKHARLAIPKTATKLDIIKALEHKTNGRVLPEFAKETSKVKPGYDKIRLLEDPMPDAANYPVYVNANGYVCMIPRGIDVIVPHRVTKVLNDALVARKKQSIVSDKDGIERTRDITTIVPSYPFQVLESNPGPNVLTKVEIGKLKTAGPKRRYRDKFGRWPRPKELTRAIEQGLIKLDDDEQLDNATSALLGTEPEL